MITTDEQFLHCAMRAYDNPSAITIDDFNRDLSQIISIKKAVRRYASDSSVLRKLVNQLVIFYNVFNTSGTDLLLYKVKEQDILAYLIPIILYLGRSTQSIDTIQVTLNTDIIRQLSEM